MQSFHQSIMVTYDYPVHFTQQLFSPDNMLLGTTLGKGAAPARILCVIDSHVAQAHPALSNSIASYCHKYPEALSLVRPPILVPGGERAKNDCTKVALIQEAINRFGLCRHSYIMAIGGGAVLDMVGYAAATTHHGIRLIRVPTTVLAQCDGGVGVINSINAFGRRDFLGTFAPPVAVFNDASFLTTLDDRDWRSGIVEAIKVALLKDAAFFQFLEAHSTRIIERDMSTMLQVIHRSVELHLEYIATNNGPFEQSDLESVGFGHWAAHKLEQLTSYRLRHGEAVAIGIALDSSYAYLTGHLSEKSWLRVLGLLSKLGLMIYTPELSHHLLERNDPRRILNGLYEFQESSGGPLTLLLPAHIGHGIEVHEIDENIMRESIALLASYNALHDTNVSVAIAQL